jgi:hypothetical protein
VIQAIEPHAPLVGQDDAVVKGAGGEEQDHAGAVDGQAGHLGRLVAGQIEKQDGTQQSGESGRQVS